MIDIGIIVFCLITASAENASLLLAGVESEIGVVELWKVQLPNGSLSPHDYVASCASMNMQPVCAGNHGCQFADNQCLSIDVESQNCRSPMEGIAASLNFDSVGVPYFNRLCNYMVDFGSNEVPVRVEIGRSIPGNSQKCVVVNEFVTCAPTETRERFTGPLMDSFLVFAWEIKVLGMQVCARRVDGPEDWSTNLIITCKVRRMTDGICGGVHGYMPGDSVVGPRYTLCAGFPFVERSAFLVESGSCVPHGDCLSSPRFPNNYLDNNVCAIMVMKAGTLHVQHFDTQRSHDVLAIHGNAYSGFHGPEGIFVNIGDEIQWRTDKEVTTSGWKICVVNNAIRWPSLAIIMMCLLLFVSISCLIVRRRTSKSFSRLVEPLLQEDHSIQNECNDLENAFEPYVFDYYRGDKKIRCIQCFALGRRTVDGGGTVKSQVRITQGGGGTRVQVSLSKYDNLPIDAKTFSCRPTSFGGLPDLSQNETWIWVKTFEFNDDMWVLDESTTSSLVDEQAESSGINGVVQIHLARVPLAVAKMLEGGADATADVSSFDGTLAYSAESGACSSGIVLSASITGEPSLENRQSRCAHLHDAANEPQTCSLPSDDDDGESSASSFLIA